MNETAERSEDEDCPPAPTHAGAHARELRIVNRKGLHARATAKFVQCVDRFEAQVKVTRCGETVGGDSIMGILTLGAGLGSTITVSALGVQAVEALDALEALVANRFDEDE
jgi:phosphocarrier protein HPr